MLGVCHTICDILIFTWNIYVPYFIPTQELSWFLSLSLSLDHGHHAIGVTCPKKEVVTSLLHTFAHTTTMPKDLPGFYWDAEKNRYFPLSSRPAGVTPSVSPAASNPNPSRSGGAGQPSKSRTSRTVDSLDGEFLVLPQGLSRRRGLDSIFNLNQRMVSSSWNWAASERLRRCGQSCGRFSDNVVILIYAG